MSPLFSLLRFTFYLPWSNIFKTHVKMNSPGSCECILTKSWNSLSAYNISSWSRSGLPGLSCFIWFGLKKIREVEADFRTTIILWWSWLWWRLPRTCRQGRLLSSRKGENTAISLAHFRQIISSLPLLLQFDFLLKVKWEDETPPPPQSLLLLHLLEITGPV